MGFFSKIAAAGLLIGAAQANPYPAYGNGTHYTTEVVTAITTYCPGATTLTYGDKTYTVTKETTLTITDCPCTISKPVAKPTKPVLPPVVYTTEVYTTLTTYCPEPTHVTYGNKTYTVTEPTTLTLTGPCPVTKTKPAEYPQPTPGKPGKPGQPEGPHNTAPGQPGKPGQPGQPEVPQTTGPVPVNPTGTYPAPEGTEPAIVTAAAGRIAPAGLLALVGALALF
ncbi:hypothetical protein FSARC_12048 [Fusarium sarcochroum]|uniref:Cell wall protein SED1 n=1 Tax=Fusarium sarcochroum TaxID=1208366 RepID=A0A8H4TB12_9HYPO|nr:hypothetical protein FSARC_12048 [Fusarium sarcochroum]